MCFNIFMVLTFAVFVGVAFVILPNFPRKRHEGNFGQTQDILTPWDELTDKEKTEDIE